jgi:hypothetical protein
MNIGIGKSVCAVLPLLFLAANIWAQTTAFNYQGRLTDGGNPANGAHQMQFKLFDAFSGGNQIGTTLTDVPITAANGIFSPKLDVGANALSGANRWLEIAVRHNSGESYVTLAPGVQITSSPYALRTLSAATADTEINAINATLANNTTMLGGFPAGEYLRLNGSGFLSIGTTVPNARLSIAGASPRTTHFGGGAMESENASAISWQTNNSGFRFGMGRTNDGLFPFRTTSPLGNTANRAIYDFKLDNIDFY